MWAAEVETSTHSLKLDKHSSTVYLPITVPPSGSLTRTDECVPTVLWNVSLPEGLVRDYYGQRWRVFVRVLTNALQTGTGVDDRLLENTIIQEVEIPFTRSKR